MDCKAFTAFLYEQIPLTAAMQLQTDIFSKEQIQLSVPLAPNKNDKNTGFGGSIACLLTVCGWSMMYANFYKAFPYAKIVVQKSELRYLAPITDDFYAICQCTDLAAKESVCNHLQTKGKGKLSLHIDCYCKDLLAATLEGTYYIIQE